MKRIVFMIAALAAFSVTSSAQTTINLNFHKEAQDGSPRFVWPFSSPARPNMAAKLAEITLAGEPQTYVLNGRNGEQYSFIACGSKGLLTNSLGGLLIVGEPDNYLALPAIKGEKLTKVELTVGNASKSAGFYTIVNEDGSSIEGIGTSGAFEVGDVIEFTIPNSKPGAVYKLINTRGPRIAILNLTLSYE